MKNVTIKILNACLKAFILIILVSLLAIIAREEHQMRSNSGFKTFTKF